MFNADAGTSVPVQFASLVEVLQNHMFSLRRGATDISSFLAFGYP